METIIIAAIPSILSGAVLIALNRVNKKNDVRDKAMRKESILILKNIDAVGCLAYQTARCHKGEKPNGNLDKAMEYREQQKHALEDHLMEVNASFK